MDGDFFAFQINTFYHTGGANNLWLCFAHGFMVMFVSLGIKANNSKQTEHYDLQCFFHYSLLELKFIAANRHPGRYIRKLR